MRKKKTVTLKDLSLKSGFSVQTISKALRGRPGMSEESRDQLIRLAQECGYRTKGQEHIHSVENIRLRPSKPYRFLLIVSDKLERNNALIQLIWRGLQDKFSEYGHLIEMLLIPYDIEGVNSLKKWAANYQIEYSDGLFITPMIGLAQEQFLLQYSVPRILINFPGNAAQVDSITWDICTAMHQSVRYLLANGHTRIMFVGKTGIHRGFMLRWQAFAAALQEAGLDMIQNDHFISDEIEKPDWIAAFTRQLERCRPTAMIKAVGNVSLVYHACAAIGKRIPDDISLVSIEDEKNDYIPELSRPLLLVQESGTRAAERMLWRIANPSQPYEHVLLQGQFYEGDTVGKISVSNHS